MNYNFFLQITKQRIHYYDLGSMHKLEKAFDDLGWKMEWYRYISVARPFSPSSWSVPRVKQRDQRRKRLYAREL